MINRTSVGGRGGTYVYWTQFDGYKHSMAISSTFASHGGRWPLSAADRSRTGAKRNSALHTFGSSERGGSAPGRPVEGPELASAASPFHGRQKHRRNRRACGH